MASTLLPGIKGNTSLRDNIDSFKRLFYTIKALRGIIYHYILDIKYNQTYYNNITAILHIYCILLNELNWSCPKNLDHARLAYQNNTPKIISLQSYSISLISESTHRLRCSGLAELHRRIILLSPVFESYIHARRPRPPTQIIPP